MWSASGRVTNATKAKASYLVQVSVVKKKTSEVLGSKKKLLPIAAGGHATFDLKKIYSGAAKDLICVPRVVRGTAG